MVVCTAWIFILFQLDKILVAGHNVGSVVSWRMRKDEQGLSKRLNVPQSRGKKSLHWRIFGNPHKADIESQFLWLDIL